MKRTALLAAGMFILLTSHSFAQEICNQAYLACMNTCAASQPTQITQDRCMQGCQGMNNACSAKYFSAPTSAYQDTYGEVPAADATPGSDPVKKDIVPRRRN